MSRKQLVGITGKGVQAGTGSDVLVVEQEIWEEWTGHTVEGTEWGEEGNGQWRAKEQATMRRGWNKDMERDKVIDKG